MLVKMKKTQAGSTNGIKIVNYLAGEQYDLPDDLYDVFVNQMKIAEPVDPAGEEKMVTPPENKAEKSTENKKDKKKDKKGKKDDEEEEKPEEVDPGDNPF